MLWISLIDQLYAKCTHAFLIVVIRSDDGLYELKHVAQQVLCDIKVLCWMVYFGCLWYRKLQRVVTE